MIKFDEYGFTRVNWPAVLQYRGDNELVFIAGQSQWDGDTELSGGQYDVDDRLIDSTGRVFKLSEGTSDFIAVEQELFLDEVVDLVRLHMSEVGLCCVAKFSAASIAEAIMMVSTFLDD